MSERKNLWDLDGFDDAKRQTMRRMVSVAAFAVPVVASFSIDSVVMSSAIAGDGTITPTGVVPTGVQGVTGS